MQLTCATSAWAEQELRGQPRCAAAAWAAAASHEWVLENTSVIPLLRDKNLSLRSLGTELKFSASSFRDSPFERQNQRSRSLGTELNNTKKMVI